MGGCHRTRLRSRYVAYRGHLLALLGREAHALVHSSALHALMECARSEQPGTFSNELYRDLLAAVVSGGHLTADLLGARRVGLSHCFVPSPSARWVCEYVSEYSCREADVRRWLIFPFYIQRTAAVRPEPSLS